MMLSEYIRHKAVFVVLALLLVGLLTFASFKLFHSNTSKTPDPTNIEQVATGKIAPAPVSVKPQVTQKQKTDELVSPDVPKKSNGPILLYVLLSVMTAALTLSVFLIFYLLKWRFSVSDTQTSIVPHELLDDLGKQRDALAQNTRHISEYIKRTMQGREKTDGDIVELQKSFAIFQDSLSKKDQEIDRLKKGYDAAVFKKFLGKFVKFYIDLKREVDAPENQKSGAVLRGMLELLEDALLECGVKIKSPAVMEQADNYKEIIGGNKRTKKTDNPDMQGKIAEVISPAFILENQAGGEVLREANIAIYVYQESEAA